MLQTLLIFSPLLIVFVFSLLSLGFGLRSYRLRQEELRVDLNERSFTFTLFGIFGLIGSGSILLFAFTRSKMIFLFLILLGMLLFLGGEVTLRRLVIAKKDFFFSLVITITGFVLIIFVFPLSINMREPFIFIYVCAIWVIIPIQLALLKSWKKKRLDK